MYNYNTYKPAVFSDIFTAPRMQSPARPPRGEARTENNMRALKSTLNYNLDLFGSIGAMRGKNVIPAFENAFAENPDLAIRIAQWARDVRGGSGERKIFRDILLHLEQTRPDILVESNLLENVPEIGRFDDLLIFTRADVKARAFTIVLNALLEGNGLAAKWLPRQGPLAAELRSFAGMSPKQWRKTLVRLTNVVETQMCNREFNSINFSQVPSVAMTRYMTAFHRRAPEAFTAYREALKRGDVKGVKVNAGAVYPYDIVAKYGGATEGPSESYYSRSSYYSSIYGGNRGHKVEDIVLERMWEALPDYMNGQSVLPVVDVSGSMTATVSGKSSVRALDVAVSLGLYCAGRTKNKALRDLVVSFSDRPAFVKLSGSLANRLGQMAQVSWGANTNLHAVFGELLKRAIANDVPAAEMPGTVLILSDMQFDYCVNHDDSALQMIRRKYEASGYELPKIVFWNLRDAGNKPVRFNERGVALISGFSPAIMKSVLSADLEKFTPESVMLETVNVPRYNW